MSFLRQRVKFSVNLRRSDGVRLLPRRANLKELNIESTKIIRQTRVGAGSF
jgi:hypothetical protein